MRGSEIESITLGHQVLDGYVSIVDSRARANT